MEAMSEILLDGLAQEQIHESLDKSLDESYGQSYQTVLWTVLVHLTAPVSNRPLRSPGNVQAIVQAIGH